MQAMTIGFNPEYSEEAPSIEAINCLQELAILEFGTPWCGHCQASLDAVNTVLDETPTLRHIKVFDGKGKRLGRQFGIKLWPTLILLKDGKEIGRIVRFTSVNEVRQLIAI